MKVAPKYINKTKMKIPSGVRWSAMFLFIAGSLLGIYGGFVAWEIMLVGGSIAMLITNQK